MKKLVYGLVSIMLFSALSACNLPKEDPIPEEGLPIGEQKNDDVTESNAKEGDDWDGTWSGGDVSVIIRIDDSYVKFDDEEMHNANAEVLSFDGTTLVAEYRITWEMYGPDADVENMPEQTWTVTMVKSGDTISYSRVAELVWYNETEDAPAGRTTVKENAQTLTKE